jgi:hypothetical protein
MVLVDNHPEDEGQFAISEELASKFSDVYRFGVNAGPPCRFVGASFATTEFVLFCDDDMMPGKRAVEAYEEQSDALGGKFSTLSDVGRIYRGNMEQGYTILRRNVRRNTDAPSMTDMTCRAHFLYSEHVWIALRDRMRAAQEGATAAMLMNDDIFMSQGIQLETGWPSYVSRDVGHDAKLRHKDLPAPRALNSTADHHQSRDALVNWYGGRGWRSKWRM